MEYIDICVSSLAHGLRVDGQLKKLVVPCLIFAKGNNGRFGEFGRSDN
jgi:hypothetical protein